MPLIARHDLPDFRHLVHRLDDPEEFAIAVSGASLRADFMARKSKPTRIEQFQFGQWAIDFHEAHVRARIVGGLPPGWASLGLMCGLQASTWYGIGSPQGTLISTPPGQPIDGCTVPGFRCVSINLAPALWERCRRLAGRESEAMSGCGAHTLSAEVFQRLHHRLQALRARLGETGNRGWLAKQGVEEAMEVVIEMGVLAWELSVPQTPGNDSLRNRARLARRAEGWLRAHYAETITMPDLCEALRVSRRELEYAFRDNFDLSPRVFLQNLRLNAIHQRLKSERQKDGTASVTEIALEHGVTHLGRFAAHYKALFGELPGAELRRRKG